MKKEGSAISVTAKPSTGDEPMSLSAVIQLKPLSAARRPGVPWPGDLAAYAEQFTHYLVRNLTGFAEQCGADLLVAAVAQRGGRTAGHEYRDGAYLDTARKRSGLGWPS